MSMLRCGILTVFLALLPVSAFMRPATAVPDTHASSPESLIEESGEDQVIRIHRKSRALELVEKGEVVLVFRVRVGAPKTPTPLGEGVIYEKRERPVFRYVDPGPKQGEIIRESECAGGIKKMPYKKMRALGIRIRARDQYSIHSVSCPETIGRAVSHGCIGMKIDDMLLLYPRVAVGVKVVITND